MSNQITMLPNEIKINNLKLSEIKSLSSGAKIMYLNYGESNTPIYIQTPAMELLWDASYFADSGDQGKFSCKLNFKGYENNSDINNFLKKMKEIDEFLVDMGVKHSKKWFSGKTLNKDTIEQLYTPMVKYSINVETGEVRDEYPPSFSFKIAKRNNKYQCRIFNENRDKLNIDDDSNDNYVDMNNILKKGSNMTTLLKCNGLWFAGGKFGCTWKAEQIKIESVKANLDNYAFRDDDEEFVSDSE